MKCSDKGNEGIVAFGGGGVARLSSLGKHSVPLSPFLSPYHRNGISVQHRSATPHPTPLPSHQPPQPHGHARDARTAKGADRQQSQERESSAAHAFLHTCAYAPMLLALSCIFSSSTSAAAGHRGTKRHKHGGAHTSTRLRSCSVGACSNEALEARLAVRGVGIHGSEIFPGHRALVLAGDARHRAKVPGWIAGGRCGDGEIVGYP